VNKTKTYAERLFWLALVFLSLAGATFATFGDTLPWFGYASAGNKKLIISVDATTGRSKIQVDDLAPLSASNGFGFPLAGDTLTVSGSVIYETGAVVSFNSGSVLGVAPGATQNVSGTIILESTAVLDLQSGAIAGFAGTVNTSGTWNFEGGANVDFEDSSFQSFESGSVLDIESGATQGVAGTLNVSQSSLQIAAVAVDATAAELNQLDEAEGGIETGITLTNAGGLGVFSGSSAVTFATAKSTAAYIILLTADTTDADLFATANSTTGFTINVSNASLSDNVTVNWKVLPTG